MADHTDKAPEAPVFTERHWYALSVSLVIIGVVLFGFAASWVLIAADVVEMKQRVDVIAPFAASFLALITFATVAWRGMVTSRQADQQKRQNDANDEATYAKLLQEAAKLIAEKDKQPQVVAGISSLEILISEPQKRFGTEAMDLLADLIMGSYGAESLNRVNRAVLRALRLGESKGLTSRIDGHFERPPADAGDRGLWAYIPGLKSLTFVGGTLSERVFSQANNRLRQLQGVTLEGGWFDSTIQYMSCTFICTRVSEMNDYEAQRHTFVRCNFSGATINSFFFGLLEFDLRQGFNYYEDGDPPFDDEGNSLASRFVTEAEMKEDMEADIPF